MARVTIGKVYNRIKEKLEAFIGRQHMFFVRTASDTTDGHLNVSPKVLASFFVLRQTAAVRLP